MALVFHAFKHVFKAASMFSGFAFSIYKYFSTLEWTYHPPHNFCSTRGVRGLLFRGGAQFAQKKFWSPPSLGNIVAPLENPFFETILIPYFKFFLPPPLPPELVLFTIKINQKDYFFWVLLTLESKNYSFA